MIKSFEPVYNILEELFFQKLPEYIEKTNKAYNDGIILKPFANKKLTEECIKLPCFKFSLDEAEYSEKDRIIENTVFGIQLQIKTDKSKDQEIINFWRYTEAISHMIEETGFEEIIEMKITKVQDDKINIRITLQ